MYDPAARGYLTDATPPERRGEAFGLYGAAQMGGLLIGPAIGAFGAGAFGGIAFVFVFSGIAALLAASPSPCVVKRERRADASRPVARLRPSSRATRRRSRAGRAAIDADRAANVRTRRRRSGSGTAA